MNGKQDDSRVPTNQQVDYRPTGLLQAANFMEFHFTKAELFPGVSLYFKAAERF
jgi:hypothetical protein